MVVTRLSGGVGNQLFQYAAGRRLALHRGVPLKLDLRHYERATGRQFSLGSFRIHADVASSAGIDALLEGDALWRRAARRVLPAGLAPRHRFLFREKSYGFDPRVLDLPAPVYLVGFWQSEKYFSEIDAQLRRELRWAAEPSAESADLLAALEDRGSIAIHVRWGDYVSNPEIRDRIGYCEPAYYRRAVAALAQRRRIARAFVFSDDPALVRRELDLPVPVQVVSSPRSSAVEDLRLLSACPNKILSNSSFSWWSAWLGRSPEQIVIAPRRWFASQELSDRDLVPDDWIRT